MYHKNYNSNANEHLSQNITFVFRDLSVSSVIASTLMMYVSCPRDTGTYVATIGMSLYCLYLAHLCALNAHLSLYFNYFNTMRTGDADLRFYITTVQDGWRKSAFLTCACFTCTIHLIMQYIEPVSEWFCWRMFIETWPHSELNVRHRASSI